MQGQLEAWRGRADWEFMLAACRILPGLAAEVFTRMLASLQLEQSDDQLPLAEVIALHPELRELSEILRHAA